MRRELRALELADPPECWEVLGFSVGYGDSTHLDRGIGVND